MNIVLMYFLNPIQFIPILMTEKSIAKYKK